jgi:diguanylate cyclase (GGDEF)-like protein
MSRFSLGASSGTSHASALQQGPPTTRFDFALEAEYQRFRLLSSRSLIRVASALAVLVAVLRAAEHALRESWNGILLVDFGLVVVGSVVVAAIAWGPQFERLYLPWARIVVPVRNAIVAAHIVEAAARGQLELLMGLPLMLFGPFFFFGLRFPAALVSGALTVASFVAAAIYFHLALPIALRSGAFLLLAVIACALAARHLDMWSRSSFLEERRIADLAQHDALTGTKNRRVFDEHLTRLWQQAIEDDRSIAILLIDVDHFKAYNDRYGHQAGDRTLRQIAQTAQRFIRRPLDILARYGGEEFAAILYDFDSTQAQEIADRICGAVADLKIEHRKSNTAAVVTISAGIAAITPTMERTPRGAVQLADQALYEAKVRGRNRIHLMDDAEHRTLVTGVFATPVL